MDLMDCRDYILSLPAAEECQPFDDEVVVYKMCQDRRGVNFCNLHLRLMLLMMQSYFIDSVSALSGS